MKERGVVLMHISVIFSSPSIKRPIVNMCQL